MKGLEKSFTKLFSMMQMSRSQTMRMRQEDYKNVLG
jgi:hypothetical protein